MSYTVTELIEALSEMNPTLDVFADGYEIRGVSTEDDDGEFVELELD
jgi:hypothetical protein